jgi:hypothetical protein
MDRAGTATSLGRLVRELIISSVSSARGQLGRCPEPADKVVVDGDRMSVSGYGNNQSWARSPIRRKTPNFRRWPQTCCSRRFCPMNQRWRCAEDPRRCSVSSPIAKAVCVAASEYGLPLRFGAAEHPSDESRPRRVFKVIWKWGRGRPMI